MTARRKEPHRDLAVAFVRVSRDATTQRLGIRAQVTAIRAWARREGVRLVRWRVEVVSGGVSIEQRARLVRAIADVEATGAAHLVVHRIDRFSRDPLSAALAEGALRRAGAALAVAEGAGAGSDPTSELVRAVLVAVGRFERQLTGARIKAALAVKAARGEMTGAPRYGFRLAADGVHVEAHPEEQATIARARELGLSVRRTIDALTAEGRLSRAGSPFTVAAMHRILSGEVE